MSITTLKDLADNNKIIKDYLKSSKDFYNLFGIKLNEAEYNLKEKILTFEAKSNKKLQAYNQVIHGGAISALLDSITGVTALIESAKEDKIVLTCGLQVKFFKKSIPGQKFTCVGRITFVDEKVIKTSGILKDENENIYAEAEAVLICK